MFKKIIYFVFFCLLGNAVKLLASQSSDSYRVFDIVSNDFFHVPVLNKSFSQEGVSSTKWTRKAHIVFLQNIFRSPDEIAKAIRREVQCEKTRIQIRTHKQKWLINLKKSLDKSPEFRKLYKRLRTKDISKPFTLSQSKRKASKKTRSTLMTQRKKLRSDHQGEQDSTQQVSPSLVVLEREQAYKQFVDSCSKIISFTMKQFSKSSKPSPERNSHSLAFPQGQRRINHRRLVSSSRQPLDHQRISCLAYKPPRIIPRTTSQEVYARRVVQPTPSHPQEVYARRVIQPTPSYPQWVYGRRVDQCELRRSLSSSSFQRLGPQVRRQSVAQSSCSHIQANEASFTSGCSQASPGRTPQEIAHARNLLYFSGVHTEAI